MGDADRLRRLISILLDNAVKYGAEGGAISLTLEKTERQARLTVANPGEPIPPEHLAHLFERFYRADAPGGKIRVWIGDGYCGHHMTISMWLYAVKRFCCSFSLNIANIFSSIVRLRAFLNCNLGKSVAHFLNVFHSFFHKRRLTKHEYVLQ